MSENRIQLAELADGLFAELRGADDGAVRGRLEEAGFGLLLVSEENGGFGGDWGDVVAVMRLAGLHALSAPLGEHIVASHARSSDGAEEAEPEWSLDAFEGDRTAMIAFLRVCQTAGALDGALALAVEYCSQRVQFGRTLSQFQAVQHSIALLACEAAAVNCAATGAAEALDRGDAAFEIAAAKLRTNAAIKTGCALAHQVHGAIGFTQEYPLNELTRPMMRWRSEGGNDAYWSARIGQQAIRWGGARLWDELTRRTDPKPA